MAFPPPRRALINGNHQFPLLNEVEYNNNNADPILPYLVDNGVQRDYLSPVSINGGQQTNGLLVIFEGVPLSTLVSIGGQNAIPLVQPSTAAFQGLAFFTRNLILPFQHCDFRRHTDKRRSISKSLIQKVVRVLVDGGFFGLLNSQTILVSCKGDSDVFGDKAISFVEIPTRRDFSPGISDFQTQRVTELYQLRDIVFNDILPGILTADYRILRTYLSDWSLVYAHQTFVLDNPSHWHFEKRNHFFQSFYKEFEAIQICPNNPTVGLQHQILYSAIMADAIADFYAANPGISTWYRLISQFPRISPIGSCRFYGGQDSYRGQKPQDLFRFIRNFIVHPCPKRFACSTNYSEKEFVDALLAALFPGLLSCLFRRCCMNNVYPIKPEL